MNLRHGRSRMRGVWHLVAVASVVTAGVVVSSTVDAQRGAPAEAVHPFSLQPDPSIACASCEEWNRPHEPFKLFGNSYYVGVAGLSAMLITSDAGHILLDGALPQSVTAIDRNIRALGFRTEDIRLILGSHEHYDHMGGIAALQRATGATVAVSEPAARALAEGFPTHEDPQYNPQAVEHRFPPVKNVRRVTDGETLQVGTLSVTAHRTPGHTPGSTTWSWRSCEGSRCLNMVYADSLNAISAPSFRFTANPAAPTSVTAFRRSIARVADLPCDVIVSVHPSFTDIDAKLKRRGQSGADPFIDSNGCRAYAAAAAQRLDQRLADEQRGVVAK